MSNPGLDTYCCVHDGPLVQCSVQCGPAAERWRFVVRCRVFESHCIHGIHSKSLVADTQRSLLTIYHMNDDVLLRNPLLLLEQSEKWCAWYKQCYISVRTSESALDADTNHRISFTMCRKEYFLFSCHVTLAKALLIIWNVSDTIWFRECWSISL